MIVKKLVGRYRRVVSVIHNYNPANTNVVLGKKSKVLYGEDFIRDDINGVMFKVSHRSFYQVNPNQTEELYKKAIDYAELSPNDIVIDAYCGIGTIGLSVANYCKTVLGVEVVKQAIEDAIDNAKINNISNAKFVAGKAEDVIKSWANYDVDALFIDPPRKGCAKTFLDTIIEMKIPKIVYISCNVATLARDLNVLQAAGYDVKEVTPFDMFPQTSHIEAVAKLRLSRQSN